jgi:DNA repair protein RecO (recombination protein O)
LLTGDWPVAEGADQRCRREASGLVAAFVAYHLDRGLRSLPHLDLTAAAPTRQAGETA